MTDSTPKLGIGSTTNRGFSRIDFTDRNGTACSLQTSSAIDFVESEDGEETGQTRSMLWLGVNDASPKIMASDARRLGLNAHGQFNGWVPYEVPEEVLMTTRMHLRVPQVKQLIVELQEWLKSKGEL